MLGTQLVVVSDAHLGAAAPTDADAFLDFLAKVPSLGDSLLINGDLFEFWFAYRRVVPRRSFQVAGALALLRRKIPIVMTGGNHDRWGDSFWEPDTGISFSPRELRFEVGTCSVLAIHGDGLLEERRTAAVLHRVTRHPWTAAMFGALHPDFGIWVVDMMSRRLADSTEDAAALDLAQQRQEQWARRRLESEPGLGLLVLSHTHRQSAFEVAPGRRYLNPGAWVDGRQYAVVTARTTDLTTFNG